MRHDFVEIFDHPAVAGLDLSGDAGADFFVAAIDRVQSAMRDSGVWAKGFPKGTQSCLIRPLTKDRFVRGGTDG